LHPEIARALFLRRFNRGVALPYSVPMRLATRFGLKVGVTVALAGASLAALGIQVVGQDVAGAVTPGPTDTGFSLPFSGAPQYENVAATEITGPAQINQAIGQPAADEIAAQLGLSKADSFSPQQYLEFVAGQGNEANPKAAAVLDASVRILTNTIGRPLYSNVDGTITPSVLASYGLFVNKRGMLESLANKRAPTRQANHLIAPGGYLGTWCNANGATKSLVALYKSAYTVEAAYGLASQAISDPWQLVANTKGGVKAEVGMSMVPSIWIVNFLLLYVLNPSLAADMPAQWAPIPSAVADAILSSDHGQVPYSEFASDFS
jgi:hypothetical protein